MGRRAFTLIEILVSLMILSIVSTAMLGILLTATELYQRGQASRSAHDELVAVTAALEDDLTRLVPERDGGWLRARVRLNNGGMAVSLLVTGADIGRVAVANNRIEGRRRLVVWWVDDIDRLRRLEVDEPVPQRMEGGTMETRTEAFQRVVNNLGLDIATTGTVMTTGCLFFSMVVSFSDAPRQFKLLWEPGPPPLFDPNLLPDLASGLYDRHQHGFPESLAVRMILTGGGRFAPQGFVVRDDGLRIRIAGVRAYPTIPGSLARIGDGANSEWVAYRSGGPGILDTPDGIVSLGRDRLYSQRPSPSHQWPVQTPVRFGQLVTLVRAAPR